MSISVADWLADAGDYLESHGWWKGNLRGPNGRQVCAYGAILFCQGLRRTDHLNPAAVAVAKAFMRAVPRVESGPCMNIFEDMDITCWNDGYAENRQQVLDIFRKAEKLARIKEESG